MRVPPTSPNTMIIEGNDPTVEPSFTLRNRLARQLWNWVWLFLFRPSPRPLHAWRAFLLRVFGASLGTDVHVYPAVRIWRPGISRSAATSVLPMASRSTT